MKLSPDSWLEALAVRLKKLPLPFLHTHPDVLRARAVMAGVSLGVFEAMAQARQTAAEIAARCGTDPAATRALCSALAASGYLEDKDGRFGLSPMARTWLLEASPTSLCANVRWRYREWEWMAQLEDFVSTGQPLDFHAHMTPDDWRLYQVGMRDLARVAASEVARKTPLPRKARTLLDIGGAHGVYAGAFCTRYPHLQITILDLPAALEAAPRLSERVSYRADDARTADLGEAKFDTILLAQLVHHFSEAENRDLVGRCARALRPGGVLVVQEFERGAVQRVRTRYAALGDLYFALTSASGLWSLQQIADWQREAGLQPRRPVRFGRVPGLAQQVARKTS